MAVGDCNLWIHQNSVSALAMESTRTLSKSYHYNYTVELNSVAWCLAVWQSCTDIAITILLLEAPHFRPTAPLLCLSQLPAAIPWFSQSLCLWKPVLSKAHTLPLFSLMLLVHSGPWSKSVIPHIRWLSSTRGLRILLYPEGGSGLFWYSSTKLQDITVTLCKLLLFCLCEVGP